jgi:hypothetical protein
MGVRLYRAVAPAGAIDAVAFRGLVAANVPVGWCGCGGWMYGIDLMPAPRSRRAWWLNARCDRCRTETATLRPLVDERHRSDAA